MGFQWVHKVLDWRKFYELMHRDIQLFFYLLALFMVFRIAFIALMYEYLGSSTTFTEIFIALQYGLKLSLKSAGLLAIVSFVLCLAIYCISFTWANRVRKYIAAGYIFLLTILFFARIPYYIQFHSGFNQLIFNTLNDDIYALIVSLVEQFQLPLRLSIAGLTAAFLFWLAVKWLNLPILELPRFKKWYTNIVVRIVFLCFIYQGAIFVNFGGSMSFAGNVGWENAGVTKDHLLNEAILDDMQALYRAYEMNGRLASSTGLAFEATQITQYAKNLTGKQLESDDLDVYLQKTAQGANKTKPKQVFLILSESYANWPLLDKYQNLNIANGMKSLIAEPDTDYVAQFLPNGMSTISAVMGIVTGFTDANLYLTTMPEAYKEPYSTAIAPQMKRLGYQAKFWYAGPASWERVKEFSLAQGFDAFYGSGDFEHAAGNVWGCDDAYLYQAVLANVKKDEPSFNIVLNVSNHSPFSVDLEREGFDREALLQQLPDEVKGNQDLIKQLGHFWYADKMLAKFIKEAKEKYPDSVFIIVGDHADRMNIDKNPTMYERYGIPFIVTGKGISKASLPEKTAGSHIDVMPTLFELIAPKGFAYYSVGTSLTRGNAFGVNYGLWITPDYIGKTDIEAEPEAIDGASAVEPNPEEIQAKVEAVRSVSWWRSKYGSQLINP
ncbi:LTA synthase family protein [Anaerosinus massiliensis]|uniref:LTA synthase family protein n=1 Tax=Massilibacillus massiliensis TaxID=1806837 RepID=UPI000B1E2621|nr:alkaline phosphatase family protein [Massilibacillus massiliensis]